MSESSQNFHSPLVLTIAQALLANQNAAVLWSGADLKLGYSAGNVQRVLGVGDVRLGTLVTEIVPELIGMEPALGDVANGRRPNLIIEYINRDAPSGGVNYLTITAYSVPGQENSPGVLLVIEDATTMGELLQELRQKRNELRLLRGGKTGPL